MVLTEIPALLMATIGGWQLLRALRRESAARLAHLTAAGAAFAAALCVRPTSILFFVGLVAAIMVSRPAKATPGRLLVDITAVFVMQAVVLTAVSLLIVGSPLERFGALTASVTSRRPDPLVVVYALALTVQFFGVAAVSALRRPIPAYLAGAFIWIAAAFLPYLLTSRYLEPRYFYTATLPLALVASAGLDRLAAIFTRSRKDLVWAGLLTLMIGLNRVICAPVMVYEIREDQYSRLVQDPRAPASTTFVTPWLSDFCFLSFAFPSERVALSLSDSYGTDRVFSSQEFRRWIGTREYVGDLQQLRALPRPWLYVGWDFSPTVRAIDDRLRLLGIRYLDDPGRDGRLLNHLTPSWIWTSDALELKPTAAVGPYRAFEIAPREVP
jgi:hypothetical protein